MSGNCRGNGTGIPDERQKKRVEDAKKTYNLLGSVKYR